MTRSFAQSDSLVVVTADNQGFGVNRKPACVRGLGDRRKDDAAMDAIEVLKTRRSVRTYKGESVPRKIIEDIVDCGRLAATPVNIQPWEFVAVTDPEVLHRIANTTDYGKFVADARSGCPSCAGTRSITSKMAAPPRRVFSWPHARTA